MYKVTVSVPNVAYLTEGFKREMNVQGETQGENVAIFSLAEAANLPNPAELKARFGAEIVGVEVFSGWSTLQNWSEQELPFAELTAFAPPAPVKAAKVRNQKERQEGDLKTGRMGADEKANLVALIASGLSNEEIASQALRSVSTVEKFRQELANQGSQEGHQEPSTDNQGPSAPETQENAGEALEGPSMEAPAEDAPKKASRKKAA